MSLKTSEFKIEIAPNLDQRHISYLHPKMMEGPVAMLLDLLNRVHYNVKFTSFIRPAGIIPGESGVHATGRAVDLVPLSRKNQFINMKLMTMICYIINQAFPRTDGKQCCMWHNTGSGFHFHIQWPWDKNFKDFDGSVPNGEEPRNGCELDDVS